jgi:hypothetical protein
VDPDRQVTVVAGERDGVVEEPQVDEHRRRCQHSAAEGVEDDAVHAGREAEVVGVDDDRSRGRLRRSATHERMPRS